MPSRRSNAEPEAAIGDLATAIGVSHRTLIARFRDATGLTPKAYAQVWRFHRFVAAVQENGEAPDWAGLAATSGCYDQPHVIRAFRRFSGWTPAEYYRRVVEFGPDAVSSFRWIRCRSPVSSHPSVHACS